jgi:hypothetical protein
MVVTVNPGIAVVVDAIVTFGFEQRRRATILRTRAQVFIHIAESVAAGIVAGGVGAAFIVVTVGIAIAIVVDAVRTVGLAGLRRPAVVGTVAGILGALAQPVTADHR